MGTIALALVRRRQSGVRRGLRAGAVIGLVLASTLVARRRGYQLGTHTVVRCRAGHVFTTIWIPGASIKAIRLGWWRFQRCPVGHHWSLVSPVRDTDLTPEQRRIAGEHSDVRLA